MSQLLEVEGETDENVPCDGDGDANDSCTRHGRELDIRYASGASHRCLGWHRVHGEIGATSVCMYVCACMSRQVVYSRNEEGLQRAGLHAVGIWFDSKVSVPSAAPPCRIADAIVTCIAHYSLSPLPCIPGFYIQMRARHTAHSTPGFPVYSATFLSPGELILGGGGGASKTGIKNKLVCLPTSKLDAIPYSISSTETLSY